jgi:uncharacterized protein
VLHGPGSAGRAANHPPRTPQLQEAEPEALAEFLEHHRRAAAATLVASLLLHTELHRAADRRLAEVDRDAVAALLSTLVLVDVERSDLLTGPLLPGRLRSAAALHLATALRVGADAMVGYDRELAAATEGAGIDVLSPC